MERAVERAGPIDAAVVGEPTNLDIATAQRGLMMVDLVARGDQRHAGYAAANGEFVNAALVLSRDLLRLGALFDDRTHPVLGRTTATPTMLDAGVSRNVTPPVATAILDVRSTPDWTHEEIADLLKARLESEVVVTSRRLVPCETPAGSGLLDAAARARPAAARFGSPTCSDWVFLRHVDAIKAGPGTSRRSHTADEYVDLPEVTAARGVLCGGWRGSISAASMTPAGVDALGLRQVRPTRACSIYTAGRRSRVGCAPPPLGRARQPRPHRGSPRFGSARRAGSRAAAPGTARRARRRRSRPAPARRRSGGRALGRRGVAHPPAPGARRAAAYRTLAQRPGRLRPPAPAQGPPARAAPAGLVAGRRARRLWAPAPARALAGLHPPAPRDAVVGGSLGRCLCRGSARYDRVAARAVEQGGPLAAGQRGRLRRAASAAPGGHGPGARLRRPRPQRGDGAGRPGEARGRGALLVHPARPRGRAPRAGRDPLQRGGVRILDAAGGARHRIEHHAAQAQSGSLRAHARPRRRARGRSRRRAPDQVASSPAAITATSSCSRSR